MMAVYRLDHLKVSSPEAMPSATSAIDVAISSRDVYAMQTLRNALKERVTSCEF